jgi:SHS2 domain-containing protein
MVARAGTPSYEFLPHVGELRLRLWGATIAEVLRQGALALGDLLNPGRIRTGPLVVRQVALVAPDRHTLLIDWLNELLFLADRDRWIPTQIDSLEASDTSLRGRIRGRLLAQAPALVKAATWHDLRFDPQDDGYEADVLLDV